MLQVGRCDRLAEVDTKIQGALRTGAAELHEREALDTAGY